MTKTTKNKFKRHRNTCKKIFANHRANKEYYPYCISSAKSLRKPKGGKWTKKLKRSSQKRKQKQL